MGEVRPIRSDSPYAEMFQIIQEASTVVKDSKTLDVLEPVANYVEGILYDEINQHSTLWNAIKSLLCKLVGRVSEYEQLQIEFDRLQKKLAKATERISFTKDIELDPKALGDALMLESNQDSLDLAQLIKTEEELKSLGNAISEDIGIILVNFKTVEATIAKLETACESLEEMDHKELRRQVETASEVMISIKTLESFIYKAGTIYHESNEQLSSIVTLVKRYESAVSRIAIVRDKINDKWCNVPVRKTLEPAIRHSVFEEAPYISQPTSISGIQNGGNTCYLASALQTINAVEDYRKVFNPEKNLLKKRQNESEDSFQLRKQIQSSGFEILNMINEGNQTVSWETINSFREKCYNFQYKDHRIVSSEFGTADSPAVLERLLNAMDYKEGTFEISRKHTFDSSNVQFLYDRDPKKFSDEKEIDTNEQSSPSIEVSAYGYLGKSADMQTLINENWQSEIIQDVKIVGKDDKGVTCVINYPIANRKKIPNAKQPPNVIRIIVKQLEFQKSVITNPEKIYPFGNNKGPKYNLRSVIEHRPEHYVAHVLQGKTMMEANDSFVHKSQADLPGFAYYYELDQTDQ